MESWKRRFKDHILESGKEYYEAGLVGEVYRSNYGYEVDVEGSELYHVKIDVSNDGSNKVIQDMYCSCPYAESGNNYKHMAAVPYKFENEGELEDVFSLVDCLSKEQLCAFVKKMIQRDASVSSLLVRFARNDIENDLDYKKEVCDIFACHEDGSGFVSYTHASYLLDELNAYLQNRVQLFMECKDFLKAFELALFLFKKLNEYDIDDSDGYVFMLCQDCFYVWKDVYELVNEFEREYIHQKIFLMSMDPTCDFIYSELIMEFLLYVCEDAVLLNERLKDVDCMIENANGTFHCVYRTMFESLHPVVFRLELMHRLHLDEKEIVEYMSKFHHISEIRQLEIDENRRLGNVKKTIELLKESKQLNSNNPIWLKKFVNN